MNVSVEFFGQSRIVCGISYICLEIPDASSVESTVIGRCLLKKIPVLADTVISSDTAMFLPSYMCNLNGDSFVGRSFTLSNGDTVLVIPSQSGG